MNSDLLSAIEETQVLRIFKNICDDYLINKGKLRNILALSTDKTTTIINIVCHNYQVNLSELQALRILQLVEAFLKKSNYRKPISKELRSNLLKCQNYECAICHKCIDESAHVDHIVPFKYTGDVLDNNLQLLCCNCNEKKSSSLDYQIRFLLKIV